MCGAIVLNSKGTINSQGLIFMKMNRLFIYLVYESHIKTVYNDIVYTIYQITTVPQLWHHLHHDH